MEILIAIIGAFSISLMFAVANLSDKVEKLEKEVNRQHFDEWI